MRAQNHHEVTLAAAGYLAGGELEGLLQDFQALRLERIQVEYGWKFRAAPADLEKALANVRLVLTHVALAIRAQRPALGGEIEPPT